MLRPTAPTVQAFNRWRHNKRNPGVVEHIIQPYLNDRARATKFPDETVVRLEQERLLEEYWTRKRETTRLRPAARPRIRRAG